MATTKTQKIIRVNQNVRILDPVCCQWEHAINMHCGKQSIDMPIFDYVHPQKN
jgi:PIN domain nuclease of toxin-antitoxin system